MEEELDGPFPYKIGNLNIEKRVVENSLIRGQGIDKDPKGILSVKSDGSVYALGKVDYEEYKKLTITLTKQNTTVAVDIVVLDVNDHAPVFNKEVYEISKDESTPQGEVLVTVQANDYDQPDSRNSAFTINIVSVSPSTSSLQFYIDQTKGDFTGKISFKGCLLDYEEAQKYTLLVEVKDHGEKVQLSSTSTVILNIIDRNNHLPEFTAVTGFMGVKVQTAGDVVCRLKVSDKDSRGSPSWRARYSLQGEKAEHFSIQTDPDTNDGLITLTQPLSFEEASSLSVIVKNEEPFFYCRVKGRPKHGLWHVDYSRGRSSSFTLVSLSLQTLDRDARVSVMETGPMLEPSELYTCLSEKMVNITAVDADRHDALKFQLIGDAERQWRLQYNGGSSVRLIKESMVHTGDHTLTIKISDSLGQHSLHSLSVHVCDCQLSENCSVRRKIQINSAAVTAIAVSFMLLLGFSLMMCQIRVNKSPMKFSTNVPQIPESSLSHDLSETDNMIASLIPTEPTLSSCM